MKTIRKISYLLISLLILSCTSVKEITTYSDLIEVSDSGDIQLITTDSTVYYFNKFSYSDSSITGEGEKVKNDLSEKFNGELAFNDISYIQTHKFDWFKTIVFAGATSAVLIAGFPVITGNGGLTVTPKIVYPSGSGGYGSCPFIYSWDGNHFILEGEAFGVGLGKKLEYETCTVLSQLNSSHSKLKVRITNERPESHFFNKIKLVAVENDNSSTVYADNHNNLWAIKNPEKLLSAYYRGKNITGLLTEDDNNYWQSDLSSANNNSGFEDKLILNFIKKRNSGSVSLIISAINTEISSLVFSKIQELMGNDYIDFLKAAENDSDIINIFKETLINSSLKVDLWNGKEWKYVDMILPEANQVKFKKLVRVPVNSLKQDTIKIRLRCMTDVWKLDAVTLDESPAAQLSTKEVKILSANQEGKNIFEQIKSIDKSYAVLLPGEKIDMEFDEPRNVKHKNISYALLAEGYLYEWLITQNQLSDNNTNSVYSTTPKLEVVKTLLKNREFLLPTLYSEWKTIREKYANATSSDSYFKATMER